MSNSHRVEKIRLFKRIIKGRHHCMICASGMHKRMRGKGKNHFVRLRRTRGC